MNEKLILLGICLCFLIACQQSKKPDALGHITSVQLYNEASKMVNKNQYDSAMIFLDRAYAEGMESPMQIVTDSHFYALVDNPEYRVKIRSLLHKYAVEDKSIMVRPNEKGQKITVSGMINDEDNADLLPGVHIELVHTDQDGFYFRENSMWNPRLFAYLKTDESGKFTITTIRPGRYDDDNGNLVASHIHFKLKKEGYRVFNSEFTFEDDSIIMNHGNIDSIIIAKLADGTKNAYLVELPMQKDQID